MRYVTLPNLAALVVLCSVAGGCAQQVTGAAEPGASINQMRSFYIVRDQETRSRRPFRRT